MTYRSFPISKPFTISSYGTSRSSALQNRFIRIRAPSFAWSMWNRTSFWVTAVKSFTGTFTSPNVSAPLQMALGIGSPRLKRSFPGRVPATRGRLPRGAGAGCTFAERRPTMPRKPDEASGGESPRTDLPPVKEPYYEGYFGTDEEEGVVREETRTRATATTRRTDERGAAAATGDRSGRRRSRRSSGARASVADASTSTPK